MAGPVVTYKTPTPMLNPVYDEQSRISRPRLSHSTTKRLERRLIRLWKRMTKTVRPNERASILPDGFILMNAAAARRRSMMYFHQAIAV